MGKWHSKAHHPLGDSAANHRDTTPGSTRVRRTGRASGKKPSAGGSRLLPEQGGKERMCSSKCCEGRGARHMG